MQVICGLIDRVARYLRGRLAEWIRTATDMTGVA